MSEVLLGALMFEDRQIAERNLDGKTGDQGQLFAANKLPA